MTCKICGASASTDTNIGGISRPLCTSCIATAENMMLRRMNPKLIEARVQVIVTLHAAIEEKVIDAGLEQCVHCGAQGFCNFLRYGSEECREISVLPEVATA